MKNTNNQKSYSLRKKLHLGKYTTSRADHNRLPFNWCLYKHSFGGKLLLEFCRMVQLPLNSCVFDPFCGGGTTLIQAKISGYDSVGLDILPVSVFLTNTLIDRYDVNKLRHYFKRINNCTHKKIDIPDVPILYNAFSTRTLKYIFSLRNALNALQGKEKNPLILALLRTLDETSKCKKSGGFLRITKKRRVSPTTFRYRFINTCENIIREIQNVPYSDSNSKAFLGDARKFPHIIKRRNYDVIFTSPPYLNRHDYTRIYALELLIGFINTNKKLKQLRYRTLRSHVEARMRYKVIGYNIPDLLTKKLQKLRTRELNNSKVISTIEGYFEDMWLFLKEAKTVLKPGGYIGLVVSNVRFAGIGIPVDIILAEIGEQIGLMIKSINILRYRGNSAQQMKIFKRSPSRESMIIWQKLKNKKEKIHLRI